MQHEDPSENQSYKSILITGGAGFIGSHLCRKYVEQGHHVICADNLQTTGSTRNIDDLLLRRNFQFIRHDIVKPLTVGRKLDWIFNFACSGSYTSYQFDPVHTVKTNTVGVINMLELARKHGSRIMQASTSEVYGDPAVTPQAEEYTGNVNMLGPRACYDEGKRCAETLFMDFHREYGVDVKIIRIFNTYGPNMDPNDGRAITNFIMRALANDDLIVYGDGSHTRSFQYVEDLIEGIDRMMRLDEYAGPVNLGNPEEVTMRELAERIIRKTGSRSAVVYTRAATDDPKRRVPDISRARAMLAWKPAVPLDKGLDRTIDYFRSTPLPAQKVLVFATTYYPDLGPAEQALHTLSQHMPSTEFHIITTKFRPGMAELETLGKDTVYRVGVGARLDKYLLPFLGYFKARALQQKHHYTFVWSVMASYGALAALLLKFLNRDVRFLLTVDSTEGESRRGRRSLLFTPLYKAIFSRADTVYVSDLATEKIVKTIHPNSATSIIAANPKSFMAQVRMTYARLLNEQQRKLERPK